MAVIKDLSAKDYIYYYLCYKGRGILNLCACLLLLVLFGRFGFYKYMKMDEEEDDRPFFFPNPDGNDREHAHPSKHITDIYRSLQIKMDGMKALRKEIRTAVNPAVPHYLC